MELYHISFEWERKVSNAGWLHVYPPARKVLFNEALLMAQKYAWELQCAYKTKQHRSNNRRPQEEGMLRRGAQQCHLQWSERPATAERLLRWLALALSGWLASRPIVQTATVSSPQSYWHQPHHLSLLLLVLLQYLNLLPRESLPCILPNEVFLKTVEHCLEIFTKENVMGKSYVTEVQINTSWRR